MTGVGSDEVSPVVSSSVGVGSGSDVIEGGSDEEAVVVSPGVVEGTVSTGGSSSDEDVSTGLSVGPGKGSELVDSVGGGVVSTGGSELVGCGIMSVAVGRMSPPPPPPSVLPPSTCLGLKSLPSLFR